MRCKQGDLAILVQTVHPPNLGKIVTVRSYCGYFRQDEVFDYNGIACRMPITDHYWWIDCPSGIETSIGPTVRAYVPDTWLQPIRPGGLSNTTNTTKELETHK